jgi:hypothetical protein
MTSLSQSIRAAITRQHKLSGYRGAGSAVQAGGALTGVLPLAARVAAASRSKASAAGAVRLSGLTPTAKTRARVGLPGRPATITLTSEPRSHDPHPRPGRKLDLDRFRHRRRSRPGPNTAAADAALQSCCHHRNTGSGESRPPATSEAIGPRSIAAAMIRSVCAPEHRRRR